MRKMIVNPENAEWCLRRASTALARMDEGDRASALVCGRRLLDGLFTLVADEIPLSDDEQATLAAFEWDQEGGRVSPYLLGRVKRAILNVAVARLVAGLAAKWSIHRRAAPAAVAKAEVAA